MREKTEPPRRVRSDARQVTLPLPGNQPCAYRSGHRGIIRSRFRPRQENQVCGPAPAQVRTMESNPHLYPFRRQSSDVSRKTLQRLDHAPNIGPFAVIVPGVHFHLFDQFHPWWSPGNSPGRLAHSASHPARIVDASAAMIFSILCAPLSSERSVGNSSLFPLPAQGYATVRW